MYAVGLCVGSRAIDRAGTGGRAHPGRRAVVDGPRRAAKWGRPRHSRRAHWGVLAPRPADEGAVGGPARSRRWGEPAPSNPLRQFPREADSGRSEVENRGQSAPSLLMARRSKDARGSGPVARDWAKGFRGQSPGPARIGLRGRSMSAIESGDHHPLIHETPRPPERIPPFPPSGRLCGFSVAWSWRGGPRRLRTTLRMADFGRTPGLRGAGAHPGPHHHIPDRLLLPLAHQLRHPSPGPEPDVR